MRVLFVSSGNNLTGISPIIKNQGESLINQGVEIEYFTIKGKGLKGYLSAIPKIRSHIRTNSYDVIHAHYSLCAFAVTLSGAKPLIISLMGSDLKSGFLYKHILQFCVKHIWVSTIVKSKEMYDSLSHKGVKIIPNGVDFNRFYPIDKQIALKRVNWDLGKIHILFAANPSRVEKNFKLASQAVEILNNDNIELHFLKNIPNDEMIFHYNASDVVLMTSLWEGSPNAIKEAMACNVPIVSTNVGDVKKIINQTEGCFVSSFEDNNVAKNLTKALDFNSKTKGRDNILNLESSTVAKIILNLYRSIIENENTIIN